MIISSFAAFSSSYSAVFNGIVCRRDYYKYGIEYAKKMTFEHGLKPTKDYLAKLKEEKTQKGKFMVACSFIDLAKVAISKSE